MDTKCLILIFVLQCQVIKPSSAIEMHADPEVIMQNGTTGTLRCTFKSSEVVSRSTSVTWSFQSSQPDNQFFKAPYVIFYFSNGKAFPGQDEYKDRLQFIGDIQKRDVSIQLSPARFSDIGTFFCDVKNPPDVTGNPAQTKLSVVPKESINEMSIINIYNRLGQDAILPCVASTCSIVTWLYTRNQSQYFTEVVNGNVLKRSARAARLSVNTDCSLVITNITTEDVGYYTCRQGRTNNLDQLVFLSVLTNPTGWSPLSYVMLTLRIAGLILMIIITVLVIRITWNTKALHDDSNVKTDGDVQYENVEGRPADARLH